MQQQLPINLFNEVEFKVMCCLIGLYMDFCCNSNSGGGATLYFTFIQLSAVIFGLSIVGENGRGRLTVVLCLLLLYCRTFDTEGNNDKTLLFSAPLLCIQKLGLLLRMSMARPLIGLSSKYPRKMEAK